MFRKEIAHALHIVIPEIEEEIIESLLETPPDPALGEYAFPCFSLAKERKKAPSMIAKEIVEKIDRSAFAKVVATGPYVNLFIKPALRAERISDACRSRTFWPRRGRGRRILIEYPSPNTNKPLHLGHVRNMMLGSTLSLLLKNDGNDVVAVNLNNDRGIHICKSMLAYKKWGSGRAPDKKSDHFVGDFYVRYQQEEKEHPELAEEAQQMLQAWEANDPGVRALWKKMNTWAIDGFHATYKRYGIAFDKEYHESEIYQEGKKIVLENVATFEKDENGAVVARLEKYGLPEKVLLRADGTSIYMTQDIALTIRKEQEYHPDLQIWVVANEQLLHFQQLFAILEMIGHGKRETYYHLSYGMISLPEGRMKSREGRVVDADDLLDELEALAAEEIRAHHADWSKEKILSTSKTVALGAIRFYILKYDPMKDFVFDPKSSISFEGDTGAYLQYTHARISSILKKLRDTEAATGAPDYSLLSSPEEHTLLRMLEGTPETFCKAAREYKPNALAVQLLEIARAFNSFYHSCPVLKAEPGVRNARVGLLEMTRQVLAEGLARLGITAPDEM